MNNSNNFFQLVAEFQKNIDWLNQILVGGESDSAVIDGQKKPSISKDIAEKWAAIGAMVQGRLAYATKFDMDMAGAPPDGTVLAEVWNDPIDTRNGLWGWTGTLWEKSPYDVLKTTMTALDGRIEDAPALGDVEFAICDKEGRAVAYISKTGQISFRSLLDLNDSQIDESITVDYEYAIVDKNNLAAFGVGKKGEVLINNTETFEMDDQLLSFAWAITDAKGNVALAIDYQGKVHFFNDDQPQNDFHKFDLSSCDSIVHVGDSHTASHYTLQNKAYISNLSAFSPYRHQNFGISGDDALDMNQRIVEQRSYFDGKTFSDMNATYAFIACRDNDGQFISAGLNYWQENLSRLVESVKGSGVYPVVCTEFNSEATEYGVHQAVAEQFGVPYVDNASMNFELGALKGGPFHQGHPGTRTNGVFWLEMLEMVDQLPRPDKSIKIFRKREVVNASNISELLYNNRVDRFQKFNELSLTHYYLGPDSRAHCDELDGPNVYNHVLQKDEYWDLQTGKSVGFSDYGLIEITLPGTAVTLDAIKVHLNLSSGVDIYVRDYLDQSSNIPGKKAGTTPTTQEYLDKWDKPRGAWREVTSLELGKVSLKNSLNYDTLSILLHKADGFSLSGIEVEYKGEGKLDRCQKKRQISNPSNLLQSSGFSDTEMANWATVGTVGRIVPIDQYNAPRKPDDRAKPVDKVAVISQSNLVRQMITVPTDRKVQYRVTAWCRYFPKGFLDNSQYQLDASQVIDSSQPGVDFDNDAELTEKTCDVRTVKLQWWSGDAKPSNGGSIQKDFACLSWRPVEFYIYSPAAPLGNGALTIELSCPDGEIQLAKVLIQEVL